jgi:hypothetical protein
MDNQAVNSFSLVEGIDANQTLRTMQKIAQFQAIVQQNLKEGHDYGTIPGCGQKPTLLKPGAEKILMLMGVTSEYEITEKVQDYDKGFFAFTVKCVLSRNGQVITEGVGHCNTREKKYTSDKQDPYTLANTCLKMAKKRAQIDATLTIASLSEIFTQDLEDMYGESGNSNHQKPSGNQVQGKKGTLSEAQVKRFYAIQKKAESNGALPEVVKVIQDAIVPDNRTPDGKFDWNKVTKQQYDTLCNLFESGEWKKKYQEISELEEVAKSLDDLPL